MIYESRKSPPLSRQKFMWRLLKHVAAALLMAIFSLAVGMTGYGWFEHLAWRDAFLNAAMLLGGMGPVNSPLTDAGKLFAGLYALYAGLIFLIVVGVMLAPMLHRVLHTFHWEEDK